MKDINYKLIESYKNNDLKTFFVLMDEYMQLGFGLDFEMILGYVKMLIKNRKYDEAYLILKSLEKDVDKYDIAEELCDAYIYCFKPHDAYNLYNSSEKEFKDKSLLIKIYLLEGKVRKAKEVLEQVLREGLPTYKRKEILECRSKIINYYQKGQFIETEYSCFIKNGNKLEEGHIVYLKSRPKRILCSLGDQKADRRPYMIWKIDGNDVYMFQVSTKCREKDYKLYAHNNYNCSQDRKIKDNVCHTTLDNILSVQDKVRDDDYKIIMKKTVKSLCLGKHAKVGESLDFMNYYVGEPKKYNIIEYIDSMRDMKYYLVMDVANYGYNVVEVDIKKNKIIDFKMKKLKKDKGIFKIMRISEDQINKYLEQLEEQNKLDDLSWKKVISKNIKYIVLTEVNGICYCINDAYSPSYIQCIEINKEDIDCIVEELTKEEILRIRKLLKQSDTKNGVKKKIKEIIY